jgi:hypothetical protein
VHAERPISYHHADVLPVLPERLIKFTWQFAGEEKEAADIGRQMAGGGGHALQTHQGAPKGTSVARTSLLPNEMCK